MHSGSFLEKDRLEAEKQSYACVPDAIKSVKKLAGRFILATNILDEGELSPEQMLLEYKEQQSTERGVSLKKSK